MPHCVAFKCSNDAKKKDPNLSFHKLPNENTHKALRQSWIDAIGLVSLPKAPHLCSKHFEEDCFDASHKLKAELVGSRFKRKLLPDAVPTIFEHKPAKRRRETSINRAKRKEQQEVRHSPL